MLPRRWPLLLILLVGAALRFYQLGAKSIWIDEAFSIWGARQPLAEIAPWLARWDQHPPLYYWLLHGWMQLWGDEPSAVRALSALCSTLVLPLLYGIIRQLAAHPTALIATGLLALSPFQLYYAQEARMYSLLTLTTAATLFWLLRLQQPSAPRVMRWAWIGLVVGEAATLWTHNAAVFFPLALNLAVLGVTFMRKEQRQSFLRHWLLSQVVVLLLWLPWLPGFVQQARMVDRAFWIQPPTVASVWATLHDFQLAFLPGDFPLFSLWDWGFWLLAGFGLWQLRRQPERLLFLSILFLLPILGALLISLRRPIFAAHMLIYVTLPYWISVAIGVQQVWRLLPRRAVFVLSLVLLLVPIAAGLRSYFCTVEKEAWDRATALVATAAQPGDLILFNTTLAQLPFDYYWQRMPHAQAIPIARHGLPTDLFTGPVLEPVMTTADLPHLHELLRGRPRAWLIYAHGWYTDPEQIIPSALAEELQLVEQQQWIGVQVLRFEAADKAARSP